MNNLLIEKDIEKIYKYCKKTNIETSPIVFLRSSFNLAIKCAENDIYSFYETLQHEKD